MFFFIHDWSGQSGKPFAPHAPASSATDADGVGDGVNDGDGDEDTDGDGDGGSGGMIALSAGAASDASSP